MTRRHWLAAGLSICLALVLLPATASAQQVITTPYSALTGPVSTADYSGAYINTHSVQYGISYGYYAPNYGYYYGGGSVYPHRWGYGGYGYHYGYTRPVYRPYYYRPAYRGGWYGGGYGYGGIGYGYGYGCW